MFGMIGCSIKCKTNTAWISYVNRTFSINCFNAKVFIMDERYIECLLWSYSSFWGIINLSLRKGIKFLISLLPICWLYWSALNMTRPPTLLITVLYTHVGKFHCAFVLHINDGRCNSTFHLTFTNAYS